MLYHLLLHATSNRRGIFVALGAVVAALCVGAAMGSIAIAIIAAATVLIVAGWWQRDPETGLQQSARVLLLPLPIIGMVAMLVGWPMIAAEKRVRERQRDPRYVQLKSDQDALSLLVEGGHTIVSRAVLETLPSLARDGSEMTRPHVFTRRRGDRLLVLVRLPALKDMTVESRSLLLDNISAAAETASGVAADRLFIGVRGTISYGAMQLPPRVKQINRFISETTLLPFYGEPTTQQAEEKS